MSKEYQTVEEIRENLITGKDKKALNVLNNYLTVFKFDPLLKGAICKNMLTERIDIVKPLGWLRDGSSITDTDIQYLASYLGEHYSLTSDKKIESVIKIVANENRYHPVCDFLKSLKWDGQERIRFALR